MALARAVFTVFLTPFLWCFLAVLVVFAGAAAAGLEVAAGAAGAGVCAANVSGMVASARAMVRIVVFILFSLAGLVARLQLHTAPCARETR